MSSPVQEQCGYTQFKTFRIKYEWKIYDFKLLPQENGQCLGSPIFSAKENDQLQWKLGLFPHGRNVDDKGYLAMFLVLHSPVTTEEKIRVNYELSLHKPETMRSAKSFEVPYGQIKSSGSNEWISDKWISDKWIERSKLISSHDFDGSITIHCKLDIQQETITKPLNSVVFNVEKGRLNHDFSQLLKNSRFCDITIIVGNAKFPVHKSVLAARSSVFASMFEHKDMIENRRNVVHIEDLEPVIVKGMLEFMYTDEVTDLEILARGLLKASDKYNLELLRAICEEVLYKTIANDNAAEILVLSDVYHSHKLKEYVMKFIDDHFLSVMQTKSYKDMVTTHPAIVIEVLHAIAVRRG